MAQFHFLRGNLIQSEDLLLELVEVYKNDGWAELVETVNDRLVELYEKSNKERFSKNIFYELDIFFWRRYLSGPQNKFQKTHFLGKFL